MRRSVLILTIALLFVTCGLTAHTLPVVSSPGEQARFVVRHQTVNVEVYNHLVRTTVSQLVFNDGDEEMPCHFDLYLPRGAHASSLTAEVDGKKYVGRIETKQAAREIVEKSREQKKAAALAEERDGVLHVELSQVKAGQEFLFTVSYIQEAEYSDGAFNYYFGIQRFNKEMKLPDSFLMNLRMDCTTDIVSATSSTHTLVGGLNGTNASFEVEDIGIIEKDFHFAYMLHLKPGEPEVMMLDQANEDPYFCMLSLPPEAPAEAASRSLVVILDKSGSMRSGDSC
ncbi:MAG: VIT domain-containing protein, partial [Planctomycetota bacterium]|nr:VIT domain-containing protein [Planctomycetota bacterium]